MNVAPRTGTADPYAARRLPGRVDPEPPATTLDFGQIFGILRRRLWLILLCILAALIVAGVILARTTPLYTASAQLKLDQQEQINRSFRDLVTDFDMDSKVIAGEIAVIESARLLTRVVDTLGLDADPEFNPALREPSRLDAAVSAVKGWVKSLVELEPQSAAPIPDSIAAAASRQAATLGEHGAVVGNLRSRISASQLGTAYIVNVAVTSEDPRKAAAIANTVVDAYLHEQLESKFATMRRVSNWLSGRMGDMRARLEESEAAVQAFMAREIGADGETVGLLEQQISEMTTMLVAARSDHAEALARNEILRRFVEASGAGAAASILASPILEANRAQLLALRNEEARILDRFGGDSAKLKPLGREIEALQAENAVEVDRVLIESDDTVSVAAARIELLDRALRDLRERALDLGRRQLELRQLEREAESNQVIYEKFLATFKESRELLDLQTADAKVISYADVPSGKSSPRIKVSLILALAAGTFAGIGIAFLLELTNRGFRSVSELASRTGVPVFGSLSRTKGNGLFRRDPVATMLRDARSQVAEEARALRTFIQMSGTPRRGVICFSSSLPGEGHTDAAILTALSFSQMGLSCVVVDADLRERPVARRLGRSGLPDIVAVLRGEALPENAVAASEHTGLCYLPAETPVADPTALLLSGAMEALLDWLRQHFDIVLLNTPPVLSAADGLTLMDRADLTLLAVRWQGTPADALAQALDLVNRIGVPACGLVLTGVKRSADASRHYGD